MVVDIVVEEAAEVNSHLHGLWTQLFTAAAAGGAKLTNFPSVLFLRRLKQWRTLEGMAAKEELRSARNR